MARLPQVGGDEGNWGTILNDFLLVEHEPDGTLKPNGTLASKADISYVDDSIAAIDYPVDSVNGQNNTVVLDTDDIGDTASNRYTNDTDIARLANTSGTNTGDQDLSGYVPNSRTVNGHALSSDVTVTKADVGLSNVDNTSDATKNSAAATLTNKDLTSATNTFPTFNQNTTGSAAMLTTARNISGVAFDGTADISLTSGSGIQKGNGSGGFTAATSNTDYLPVVAPAMTGSATADSILWNNNAVTVAANACTVPVTKRLTTITNNAAGAVTITITTSGATDGQLLLVRFYDFSAVVQTLSWVNTENSSITVPTASNGSTTLPLTVGFQYNSATSKWRCIAAV